MDTGIWISYNFNVSWNVIFCLNFPPQLFKNIKNILRLQALQKQVQAAGWLWPIGHTLPAFYLFQGREGKVAESCPTLCDPMDCSLPGFSVHGIFQARVLKWVAISFSRGSSWPRDRTWVSRVVGKRFTHWATREAQEWNTMYYIKCLMLGIGIKEIVTVIW